MNVTEKTDVYSFGVIALEVIKGRHPGDQILSLSVSPKKENTVLEDILDPRLPSLTTQDEREAKCQPTIQANHADYFSDVITENLAC